MGGELSEASTSTSFSWTSDICSCFLFLLPSVWTLGSVTLEASICSLVISTSLSSSERSTVACSFLFFDLEGPFDEVVFTLGSFDLGGSFDAASDFFDSTSLVWEAFFFFLSDLLFEVFWVLASSSFASPGVKGKAEICDYTDKYYFF